MALLETLVALAILGLVAVAFLSGLSTAARATFIADEQATAESLARSQMEYVKSQDYSDAPWAYELPPDTPPNPPSWWDPDAPPTLPAGYDGYYVSIWAEPLHVLDDGIRKIRVTVNHRDKEVLTVVDYKVDR